MNVDLPGLSVLVTVVLIRSSWLVWLGVDDPWIIPEGLRRFRLQELEEATQKFSQKHFLGMGGFGNVYQGFLNDGKIVAIKCASLRSAQGHKEFQNELTLLARLHHRNLVGLLGFCDDGGLQVCPLDALLRHVLPRNVVLSHMTKTYDPLLLYGQCSDIGV